jgi:hypothetical protein
MGKEVSALVARATSATLKSRQTPYPDRACARNADTLDEAIKVARPHGQSARFRSLPIVLAEPINEIANAHLNGCHRTVAGVFLQVAHVGESIRDVSGLHR